MTIIKNQFEGRAMCHEKKHLINSRLQGVKCLMCLFTTITSNCTTNTIVRTSQLYRLFLIYIFVALNMVISLLSSSGLEEAL